MTDNNTEIDIFAPPAPSPEDEKAITLKRAVDELRVQLRAMIQSAPAEDDETDYLEKEDWCRRWKHLIESLTTRVQIARQTAIDVQLTDAERQDGRTGNKIHEKLERHVSAMKEATAMQAETATQAKLPAEQEKVEKDGMIVAEEDEEELNGQDEDEVWDDQQDGAQEENLHKDAEVTVEEPPIKRSTGILCLKKITLRVPSEPDVEVPAVAAKTGEPVIPQKKTPRMSAKQPAVNAIPCAKCASTGRTCYGVAVGLVCMDSKGKGKQKSISSPNPTPAPTVKIASAPKPRPTPMLRPSPAVKAGPAPKAAQAPLPAPKGKGKAEDAPTIAAAPQRTAPGHLGTLRPYVDIKVHSKRKFVEIEEESSESEHDDDDEDAYMAGRLNGLHTFVGMFETALGALKKEVTEIDGRGSATGLHDLDHISVLQRFKVSGKLVKARDRFTLAMTKLPVQDHVDPWVMLVRFNHFLCTDNILVGSETVDGSQAMVAGTEWSKDTGTGPKCNCAGTYLKLSAQGRKQLWPRVIGHRERRKVAKNITKCGNVLHRGCENVNYFMEMTVKDVPSTKYFFRLLFLAYI
ncbi:hypothetical protein BDR05DRAFT_952990 [Suillus weaverae]|nr:hypothetical protein BDR05DRAFT_952990 [Suillus weaverae]